MRDFHMVRSKKGDSYVTNRYYLADAEFLVGFESADEELLKRSIPRASGGDPDLSPPTNKIIKYSPRKRG